MVMIASALERVDTEGIGVSEASKGDDRYWAVKVAVQGDTSENMIKGRVSVTNNTGIYRNDAILAQGRRASVSRRQSVMMRSRPGSGSRANSVFRSPINRVPRERVLELWKAVRAAFLKKTPDIVNLLNNSAPIPYSLSIRQGFQFKYKLNVKHHIRCVSMHPRVPWHHAEGRVDKFGRKRNEAEIESDNEKQTEEDEKLDALGSKVHKVVPYTFVCIDHSRTVRIWDVARSATLKPRSVVKLSTDLFQCVFLARFSMYAGCSDDKSIKFFTPKFELSNIHYTQDHIQHIQYNSLTHEIVTASSHSVTVWTLTGSMQKGLVRIDPAVKFTVSTGLPVDEWITGIFIDEKNHKVYAIINTKIMVFSAITGEELDRWFHVSFRQITCMNHFDMYHYTILGCTNGSIKVKNMTDALVHEFNSHTKPVTSIAFCPYGPLVISCALDYSVRMYNLKTFKEVYCLHLREKPISLKVMDDNQLYIVTRNTIMVWSLNPINTGFSTINTHVTRLIRYKSPNLLARVLVRSDDGVIRLMSPISGKVITTSLPLLETDRLEDLVYCPSIDRLFLLVDSGEVWIIATNLNPCVVVNVWRLPQSAKEDIGCISIYEGKYAPDCDLPEHIKSRGFVFFLAGTNNGQILFYNVRGTVAYRVQLHMGGITQMISDLKQQLLITGGEDCAIRISTVDPLAQDIITIKVTIGIHFIPRLISVLDNNICATSDDWTVNMYMFNLHRGDWRLVPNHSKSDDHTDIITAICCVRKLGLFVTSSRDSTIRVWDTYNSLVREIQFQEPLESLCVANSRGDLLLGIQNRIDIIRYSLYLPPGYIKTVELTSRKEKSPEPPISFNEGFNFKENYSVLENTFNMSHQPHIALSSEQKWIEYLSSMNFAIPFEDVKRNAPVNTRKSKRDRVLTDRAFSGSVDAMEKPSSHEVAFQQLLDRLGALVERRKIALAERKRLKEVENAELSQQESVMQEEMNLYLRHKDLELKAEARLERTVEERMDKLERDMLHPAQGDDLSFSMDDIEISFLSLHTSSPLAQSERTLFPYPVEEDKVDFSPQKEYRQSITIQEIINEARKEGKLKIAPDGEVPNSVLFKLVADWKATHKGFTGFEVVLKRNVKKLEKQNSLKEDERKKKSDLYKAKLKHMVEEIEKEKEKDAVVDVDEAIPKQHVEDVHEESDDENVSYEHNYTRRLPGAVLLNKPTALEPRKDLKYPKIVEQAIVYSWFPQDEIFYPTTQPNTAPTPNPTTSSRNASRREMRKLKVDANGDSIMPIVLECFRTASSASVRIEIVEYLNWIFEEFGFRDTTSCSRLFCRYLQGNMFTEPDEKEIELRMLLIDSLAKYGSSQTEVIPTLVMQLLPSSARLKEKAKEALTIFGGSKADTKIFLDAIEEHFQEAQKAVLVESLTKSTPDSKTVKQMVSPAIMDFRNNIVAWLRRNLKKYLLKTCKDPEALRKLKELSDNGRLERGKKNDADKDDDMDKDDDKEFKPRPSIHKIEASPVHKGVKGGRRASIAVGGGRASRRSSLAFVPREIVKPVESKSSAITEALQEGLSQAIQEDEGSYVKTSTDSKAAPQEYTADHDPLAGRNPVIVLQNPSAQDFAAAINFYVTCIEKKIAKEEQERLEKLARESRAAEEARMEQERQMALVEFMRRKELERQFRIAQRKEKIAEMRANKRNPALPRIKRVKSAKLFTGGTHHSMCHPSRETLDTAIHKFPPLYTNIASKGYRGAISLHFQRMNKSMPVENVTLVPFEEQNSGSPIVSRLGTSHSATNNPSARVFCIAPEEVGGAMDIQTQSELDYIRRGGAGGLFFTQRKYFVHDMTASEP